MIITVAALGNMFICVTVVVVIVVTVILDVTGVPKGGTGVQHQSAGVLHGMPSQEPLD